MHRRLREGEEARELRCKEMLEIRRALGDETREKEIMQKSNTELRAAIKKTESERIRLVGCSAGVGCTLQQTLHGTVISWQGAGMAKDSELGSGSKPRSGEQ